MHHPTKAASDTSRDIPAEAEVPAIPVRLAHRPTIGGLVVPYITPHTDDGRYLFGGVDPHRQWQCLNRRLCSVCGRALIEQPGDRLILLMRLSDLPQQRTSEPALDPVCAAYTQAACPMVAGRLSHYRSTPMRLGPGMAPGADQAARLGAPAEPWFAVWLHRLPPGSRPPKRPAGRVVHRYPTTTHPSHHLAAPAALVAPRPSRSRPARTAPESRSRCVPMS